MVAWLWGAAALAGLVLLAWLEGFPSEGEQGYWEELAQAGLLAVYAAGLLLSLVVLMTGGTVMAVAASGVGMLAALQYRPLQAVAPALVLFVPAFLLWVSWQRRQRSSAVAVLAAVLTALLAVTAFGARAVWDAFYGPSHPTSITEALPVDRVRWVWSGAVGESSAVVRAGLRRATTDVRLAVSTAPDLTSPTWFDRVPPAEGDDPLVATFALDGLAPGTEVAYAVVVDGTPDQTRGRGRLRTFAPDSSFTVAFGSCARLGSSGRVFDAILAAQPDLFVITGDWFYEDIAVNDRSAFRSAYDTTLTAPAQAALYRAVPVAYLWDDHDYGPNDANRTSASRPAAMATYRERVPHYPLGIEGADTPIAQAFTIGRVRFLVTDERSARDPQSEPDGPGKTMLGAEQKAWLETELRAASGQYPLIVWVTSVPWITPEEPGADHWGGYATERRELADFIESEGIAGLVMIAGDAHMVAIDDGTNNTFASSGARGFPVVHAAALDRPGSFKGGPYSHGAHPGPGQYGTMTVEDRGVAGLAVELRGVDWEGTEYVRYTFTAPTP